MLLFEAKSPIESVVWSRLYTHLKTYEDSAAVIYSIYLIALALLAAVSGVGHATAQTKGETGQFTDVPVYTESSVEALVDHQIANPAYLVGKFIYLGQRNGLYVFSTFSQTEKELVFGRALIAVRFFDSALPGLDVGKIISPTPDNPLTITSVIRSKDFIFIQASTNNNNRKVHICSLKCA